MRLDLSGKVALITGASRGIGRQTALTLAGAGATVVLTSRGDAAAAVAAEVTAAGGQALALAADVSDAEAVQRVIETTTELMLMMRPLRCLSIVRSTACVQRKVPVRLVATTASQSSRFILSNS